MEIVLSLGFADAIFRRERSDDRKCVCGSQARFHCIIVSLWAWYLFWWDSQFIQLPLSEASGLSSAIVSVMLKV